MRSFPMTKLDIRCVNDEYGKTEIRTSHMEYRYVHYLESMYDDREHSFESSSQQKRKMFNMQSTPDAYSPKARKIFYAHGCMVSFLLFIQLWYLNE